jgi:membrane-bound metal-dependent hydrolase YbcI (DUF457 family)
MAISGAVCAGLDILLQQARRKDGRTSIDWGEVLGWAAGGALLGLLPDMLEPASSPNHRRFFHSIALAAGITRSLCKKEVGNRSDDLLFLSGTAYLSHLAADACTPKCLPLL